MRRKPMRTDPVLQERQERIDRLRERFEIPKRHWLGAPGTFAADGRTIIFEGMPADRAELSSVLVEVETEGEDTPEVVVFIPHRRLLLGTLSPSLRGGYLLRIERDEIIAFQMVAVHARYAGEFLKTDSGEYLIVPKDRVAAWDGTSVPPDEIDKTELLAANFNGMCEPYDLD